MQTIRIGKKQSLSGNIAITHANKVQQTCRYLTDSFPIQVFRYTKILADGNRITLTNCPEFICYFYEDGIYPLSWFDGHSIDKLDTGWSYWAINLRLPRSRAQEILTQEIKHYLKVCEGITFIHGNDSCKEVFEFMHDHPEIYTVPKKILLQFCYFFKQETKNLIDNYADHLIEIPNYTLDICSEASYISDGDSPCLENPLFPIRRYYITDKAYITAKEFQYIELINKGWKQKSVAHHFGVSIKTIESALDSARKRLKKANNTDLIGFLREQCRLLN